MSPHRGPISNRDEAHKVIESPLLEEVKRLTRISGRYADRLPNSTTQLLTVLDFSQIR